MKVFVVGAELSELEACLGQGLCEGVVVEAALGRGPAMTRELLVELCRAIRGPIFVDVASRDADAMAVAARDLAAIAGSIVPRLPFGDEGLKAMRACAAFGLRTNAVGCATAVEALAAARAGAKWISPCRGLPADPTARAAILEPIRKMLGALESFEHKTQVLVAPVEDRSCLVDVALAGAHAAAARPAVLLEIARRRAEGREALAGWPGEAFDSETPGKVSAGS
jgi:transaldolase